MGKKLTFIGALLAIASLIPYALYRYLINDEDQLSLMLGMVTLIGFPLFSLVSFIGMMIWAVAEIRKPSQTADQIEP